MKENKQYEAMKFGDDFPDGRLTADPGDQTRVVRLNDILLEINRLGRPLTDEEAKKFYA